MKGETTYMKTLGKVEAKLSRMKEQAAAVRWFYENGNLPESYNRALRLEELSEQAVLLTRVLPAYTGAAGATAQTDAIISDTIPVEVGFTAEGWFSVRIPALLPKKASGSADYIRSYLYPAMRKFFEGKPPVRFRDCVLAYRHVYDRSRPERAMRDHDNIETNMVTDILALYVLPDDHPAVCSHYYCSAAGSEDRTEVYVMLTGITWTPFGNTNSPGMPHTETETTVLPKPWRCVCAQVLNADRICFPFFKTGPLPNGFPRHPAFILPKS